MKKRIFKAAIIFLIISVLACGMIACNSSKTAPFEDSDYYVGVNGSTDKNSATNAAEESAPNRKIIYTVTLTLTAENISDAVEGIKKMLNADEWADRESIQENASFLTLRIKTERLDAFTDGMSSVGEVSNYEKTGKDISVNYSDTAVQIETLNAERSALLDLQTQSGLTVSDLITINQRLSEINTKIDELSGTIKNYDSLIEYSTVYVSVYQKGYVKEYTFGDRLKDAFGTGWNIAESIFIFLIVLLPFVAVIALIFTGVILLRRKAKGMPLKKRGKKKNIEDDENRMDHIA